MSEKIRILYVDDEFYNLNSFKAYFRKDYEIYTCLSREEALRILNSINLHIIVADQRMPNMTGVEFLDESNTKTPEPIKIVVTAYRDISMIDNAFKEGRIFCYHTKPWHFDDLTLSIETGYKSFQINKI